MASLTVDPPTLTVPAGGGESTHTLNNSGETRLAFKIKSSNNDHYRLKPVYGYVEPGATAEFQVVRLVSLLSFLLSQLVGFTSPAFLYRS